jgi:hypothetical protein
MMPSMQCVQDVHARTIIIIINSSPIKNHQAQPATTHMLLLQETMILVCVCVSANVCRGVQR